MNMVRCRVAPEYPSVVDRVFDSFFNEAFVGEPTGVPAARTLALDVSETEKEVIVRASLPGFKKEEVSVELHEGVLTIRAERAETVETAEEHYHRRERRAGVLFRRLALPENLNDGAIQADLSDGVLTLRLAKSEREQPRKIVIR